MREATSARVRCHGGAALAQEEVTQGSGEVFDPNRSMALLVGLAEQGTEVKEFTDSERHEMRLGKSFEGKVVELMEGRRVVLGEGWMCFGRDGAAYRFAEYYFRRQGKWVRLGEGKFLGE
jgi:hypothetical protein